MHYIIFYFIYFTSFILWVLWDNSCYVGIWKTVGNYSCLELSFMSCRHILVKNSAHYQSNVWLQNSFFWHHSNPVLVPHSVFCQIFANSLLLPFHCCHCFFANLLSLVHSFASTFSKLHLLSILIFVQSEIQQGFNKMK